jgi:hypothetical protein
VGQKRKALLLSQPTPPEILRHQAFQVSLCNPQKYPDTSIQFRTFFSNYSVFRGCHSDCMRRHFFSFLCFFSAGFSTGTNSKRKSVVGLSCLKTLLAHSTRGQCGVLRGAAARIAKENLEGLVALTLGAAEGKSWRLRGSNRR